MAFIYPQFFPFGCAVPTETDPTTLVYENQQPYLWGFSLEEAMHIFWKVKNVFATASYTSVDPMGTFTESASNVLASKTPFPLTNTYDQPRMRDVICIPDTWSLDGEFALSAGGSGFFSVIKNDTYPVYFFDGSYYPFIRAGANDVGFTQSVSGPPTTGSLTVDFGGFTRTSTNAKSSQNPSTQVEITCNVSITVGELRQPV